MAGHRLMCLRSLNGGETFYFFLRLFFLSLWQQEGGTQGSGRRNLNKDFVSRADFHMILTFLTLSDYIVGSRKNSVTSYAATRKSQASKCKTGNTTS